MAFITVSGETGCRTEDNGMAQSTAVLADVENPQINAIELLQQM